ncbi:MAG TPA: hypothetical protein VIV40_29715 [Kofleriaceae bacterium]
MTKPSSQLARDVATELDRRRRRRKLLFISMWSAAIIAAILYLRCGAGWGTGGKGAGKGPGSGASSVPAAGPKRCVVRVSAQGIAVDGKQMKREDAVAACKQTEGALITVTGDARQGDWDDLRAALEAAGVKIFTRGDR